MYCCKLGQRQEKVSDYNIYPYTQHVLLQVTE